jgi:transcriptional regulator with XRE-family HTH domain
MQSCNASAFVNDSWQTPRNRRTLQAYMALQNREIGARLRELRGQKPQTAVADELGVSERTYQNWEAGDAKPSYRNLQRVAEYFGVREDYILAGEPERTVINGKVVQDASVTPSPFPERTIEGALAGILAQIQAQLAEQTEVLNEIRQLLTSDQQVTTETQEATQRLLGAVDVASRALRGDAPRTAEEREPRAK